MGAPRARNIQLSKNGEPGALRRVLFLPKTVRVAGTFKNEPNFGLRDLYTYSEQARR